MCRCNGSARSPVGHSERRSRVDEREIAHDAHIDIVQGRHSLCAQPCGAHEDQSGDNYREHANMPPGEEIMRRIVHESIRDRCHDLSPASLSSAPKFRGSRQRCARRESRRALCTKEKHRIKVTDAD